MKELNQRPPSVNFHINTACNFKCGFCFARFNDVEEEICGSTLRRDEQLRIVRKLALHFDKITFAGGEPTLVPWLDELIAEAYGQGMTTMLVTNGSRLTPARIAELSDHLDWLVLSVDSAVAATNERSGRAGRNGPLSNSFLTELGEAARLNGIRLKMNTVVHRMNADEDLSGFVKDLVPERWKLMQVLSVEDQNGDDYDRFELGQKSFDAFVERHGSLKEYGIDIVPEPNDLMRGSYAMVDPAGRFFDSSSGLHSYSARILDVGVERAFEQVTFDARRFDTRGGRYAWASADFVCFVGISGAGKDTAADFLTEEEGFVKAAIADPIKEAVADLFDLTEDQLWGEARNVLCDRLGCAPRHLLQRFGQFTTDIDAEIWVRRWMRVVRRHRAAGKRVITTDVRTVAELHKAKDAGALIVRIRRDGAGAGEQLDRHPHETELSLEIDSAFDVIIDNNGTLEDLRQAVLGLLQRGKPV